PAAPALPPTPLPDTPPCPLPDAPPAPSPAVPEPAPPDPACPPVPALPVTAPPPSGKLPRSRFVVQPTSSNHAAMAPTQTRLFKVPSARHLGLRPAFHHRIDSSASSTTHR